jgi:hypothetical protein
LSRCAGWTCRCVHSVADAPSIAPRHVGKRISLSAMNSAGHIVASLNKRRMNSRLSNVMWIALAAGCGYGNDPSVTDRRAPTPPIVPGCYRLMSGPWENDSRINRIYGASRIPRAIQLDTARFIGYSVNRGGLLQPFVVRTLLPDPGGRKSPFIHWQGRVGSDTIRIAEPEPLWGVELIVAPTASGLSGHLKVFTDDVPSDGVSSVTTPIELERIPCLPR